MHNITQVSYITGVPLKCLNTKRMVQYESCHHIFTISHFLLLSCESQRLSEIKDPHMCSKIFYLCQNMSCLIGVQVHCPTISIAHKCLHLSVLNFCFSPQQVSHEGTFPHMEQFHTLYSSLTTLPTCVRRRTWHSSSYPVKGLLSPTQIFLEKHLY